MERVVLKDFTGGINRATDPVKMRDNEFYDLQNVIIYRLGSLGNAVKRNGITSWHSTNQSTTFKALQVFQYISNSKAVNFDRLIVKTATELKYLVTSTPATAYADIIGADADVSGKVKFLVYRDNLYIFNRNSSGTYQANKFYDGTNILDMGLIPADNNITLALYDTTTGGRTALAKGIYKYIITYVYDGIQESYFLPNSNYASDTNGSPGNAFFLSTGSADKFAWINVNSTSRCVQMTLPTGNARVTARRIYRTKVAGNQFYFLGEVPNNTDTVFIDDTPDTQLFDPIDLEARFKPPIAKYGVFHKDRMFIANLKEDIYLDFPDSTITLTGVAGSALTLLGKYSYKFYPLYLYPTLNTGASGVPLQGFLGKVSSTQTHQLTTTNQAINISTIPNTNSYAKQILIERNCSTTVSNYNISTNVVQLTVATGTGTNFKTGETITLSGIASPHDFLNGSRVVTATGANTVSFALTNGNVSATPITGLIEGGNFYYLGVTGSGGTAFDDTVADSSIIGMQGILEQNGIEKLTANKILPSTLQWSDINYGDSFPPDNSIEIEANDNDVITGLISEDDGVLIFKERNIYKLFTDRESTYWTMRKVVSNVGCSEPYSIVTIGTGLHLFMFNGQIYLYNNGQVRKIGEKIQSIIDGLGTLTNVDVCFHPDRNWVVYTMGSTKGTITANDIFVLDLNFPQDGNIGSWYYFTQTDSANNKGLTVRSPLSTKQGLLLFGNDFEDVLQYRKTDAYSDYINDTGVIRSGTVPILIKKYFDFDEWTIKRILAKFTAGTIDNITATITGTSITIPTGITTGRINTTLNSGLLDTEYLQLYSAGTNALEIREFGFDYEPKHKTRGAF